MKKWIFAACVLLLAPWATAQDCTNRLLNGTTLVSVGDLGVYSDIVIELDATQTTFAHASHVSIWAWNSANSNNAPSNGEYFIERGPVASHLESLGGGRWRFRMNPRTFYATANVGPKANFLFRGFNANGQYMGQTGDMYICLKPATLPDVPVRIFPINTTQDDAVTVYFNQQLLAAADPLRTAASVAVYMEATLDNGDIIEAVPVNVAGSDDRFRMRSLGPGNFAFTFIPARLLTIPAGRRVVGLRFELINRANLTERYRAGTQPFYVDGN